MNQNEIRDIQPEGDSAVGDVLNAVNDVAFPELPPTGYTPKHLVLVLLASTVVGAVAPVVFLFRPHELPAQREIVAKLPVWIAGFAAVGLGAGIICVLVNVSLQGKERSKARGESLVKWNLLQILAAILFLPVAAALCLFVLMLGG